MKIKQTTQNNILCGPAPVLPSLADHDLNAHVGAPVVGVPVGAAVVGAPVVGA